MIVDPSFIKGEGQSVVYIIVHGFKPGVFDHFVLREYFALLGKRFAMVSIARKINDYLSFLLFDSLFLKGSSVYTTM
jgi:hypothetical protein